MKKLSVAVFAAFLASSFVCSALRDDWAQFEHYAASNSELSQIPSDRRVVFFGNSITEIWGWTDPDFFDKNEFVDRGICGQSTYQFLSRFRRDVIELKPVAVVINAATNDIAENTHPYNEDITMGNIMSMVELAQANGIEVILTSTLPAGYFSWNSEIKDGPQKIASLNRRIAALAQEKNIPFVDYYAAMISADGRNMKAAYTDDGVHPTAEGYKVMEALILPVVRRIVP